jgi:hypothetical protein
VEGGGGACDVSVRASPVAVVTDGAKGLGWWLRPVTSISDGLRRFQGWWRGEAGRAPQKL